MTKDDFPVPLWQVCGSPEPNITTLSLERNDLFADPIQSKMPKMDCSDSPMSAERSGDERSLLTDEGIGRSPLADDPINEAWFEGRNGVSEDTGQFIPPFSAQ